MKMLIAQLQNQDPTNPMDNAQMTSQLAQLSTVDGINQLNNTMTSLINNTQSSMAYQAANLIGHNVHLAMAKHFLAFNCQVLPITSTLILKTVQIKLSGCLR
jgi:flagellar hook assembly protein FlgD